MQDQQLDQNNSNSQIEIDVQQQNQEHQVNGERGQIYLNFQQNQNQSQQYEQQDQQIQNNNIQYIQQNNNQVEELQQQQQQNDLSLQSKANQEMHIDIENQNDQVQDSFQNAKQYPFCQDIKKNYKIIIFNKKRNASSIKYNIQDQMAKQFNSKNVIQTDSNGVIPLGDNIHQSKTQEFQLSQTDQQPSQIHQNQEILGFGSFKIDQNRKIIEFGESESSEETIQEKFQIKRENKQYFDNEQEVQLNNLERKHEENIPSTYREKQQSNTCIDIKQQKLILKHKQKKQQSKQDLSKIENNTQYIEQNQEQIHSIQENNNDENQQNIQQIQQHDNTLVPDKTSSINQQIKQIQCVKDNEDHSSGQQIFQEQSNTDHHIQQQQQQMHENQVELINFECNESIEIQNDNIKSTSDQHQGLGLNMEDIQVILSNEENVPSQKTFDQQSARKQSHNNDIKSDWQKYLKNE